MSPTGTSPRFVIEVQFPKFMVQGENEYQPAIAASKDWMEETKIYLGSDVDITAKEHSILEVGHDSPFILSTKYFLSPVSI